MGNVRECEQCGGLFVPPREHARFCSARCRVAWNRLNTGAPGTGDDVLDWSVTALRDTTDRLLQARSLDGPACHALISEAVWWSTMVDATMVRYHQDAYAAALARRDAAARRVIEDTFGGLRFARTSWSPPPAFPAARTSGSRTGPGSTSPRKACLTWRRRQRNGSRPGTGPTRPSWRASPSETPSAGPPASCERPPGEGSRQAGHDAARYQAMGQDRGQPARHDGAEPAGHGLPPAQVSPEPRPRGRPPIGAALGLASRRD
jgi:hypothetical protein